MKECFIFVSPSNCSFVVEQIFEDAARDFSLLYCANLSGTLHVFITGGEKKAKKINRNTSLDKQEGFMLIYIIVGE